MLTATDFVYENPDFDPPPTESILLNWLPKNLTEVIMSVTATPIQNLVQIRPQRGYGQMR